MGWTYPTAEQIREAKDRLYCEGYGDLDVEWSVSWILDHPREFREGELHGNLVRIIKEIHVEKKYEEIYDDER